MKMSDIEEKIGLEYENAKLKKANLDLADKIKKLEIECTAKDALLEESREEKETLSEDHNTLSSKYEETKEDLTKCRQDVGRKNGMIDDSAREIKRLRESLDIAKGLKVQYEEESNKLFKNKEDLLDENRGLLEEIVGYKERIRELEALNKKKERLARRIVKLKLT